MSIATTLQSIFITAVELVVITLLGILIGRIVERVAQRSLLEIELKKVRRINISILIPRTLEVITYLVTFVVVTQRLGVTRIILLGVIGIVAVLVLVEIIAHAVLVIPNLRCAHLWRNTAKKEALLRKCHLPESIVAQGLLSITVESKEEKLIVPYTYFFSS